MSNDTTEIEFGLWKVTGSGNSKTILLANEYEIDLPPTIEAALIEVMKGKPPAISIEKLKAGIKNSFLKQGIEVAAPMAINSLKLDRPELKKQPAPNEHNTVSYRPRKRDTTQTTTAEFDPNKQDYAILGRWHYDADQNILFFDKVHAPTAHPTTARAIGRLIQNFPQSISTQEIEEIEKEYLHRRQYGSYFATLEDRIRKFTKELVTSRNLKHRPIIRNPILNAFCLVPDLTDLTQDQIESLELKHYDEIAISTKTASLWKNGSVHEIANSNDIITQLEYWLTRYGQYIERQDAPDISAQQIRKLNREFNELGLEATIRKEKMHPPTNAIIGFALATNAEWDALLKSRIKRIKPSGTNWGDETHTPQIL